MKRIQLRVGAEDAGQRLDKFLAARSGLSRGACRRAIAEGGVWIGGRRVRQLSLSVQKGRVIEIAVEDRPMADFAEPRVIFEDASLLVLDKPAGLPSQGTLASDRRSALGWAQQLRGEEVRTVHRLDIGTSGVLLLAKTAAAATALAAQFKEGLIEKRYLALCVGELPAKQGRLEQRIRPSARRGVFEVGADGGVPAVTDYQVLASRTPLLLVEARPRTGRTHQIRVHLSAAGAPLLGDARYGGPGSVQLEGELLAATRPLLHAAELSVTHPQLGTRVTFEAEPPVDFEAIRAKLAPLPRHAGEG
jgi:23S rRNA pseudouridine1911/1915/1917 synthase